MESGNLHPNHYSYETREIGEKVLVRVRGTSPSQEEINIVGKYDDSTIYSAVDTAYSKIQNITVQYSKQR